MMGLSEFLVLISVVVIAFNWRKFSSVGESIGKTIRGFKSGLKGEEPPRPLRDVSPKKDPGE